MVKEKKKFNQGLIIRKIKLTKKSYEPFIGDSVDDEKEDEDDPEYFNVQKKKLND